MKVGQSTPWPKMPKQSGCHADSIQSILQDYSHIRSTTRGLLSYKTEVLFFQTRFLAGLFLGDAATRCTFICPARPTVLQYPTPPR